MPLQFQFQNGTIMRPSENQRTRKATKISIPKWYDYEWYKRCKRNERSKISIPKWYDYEPNENCTIKNTFKFQFQNGTIMRHHATHANHRAIKFQFQNGTIMRSRRIKRRHDVLQFQFQNGTIMSAFWTGLKQLFANFNSKMVRLWDSNRKGNTFLNKISIPKWYDYELQG